MAFEIYKPRSEKTGKLAMVSLSKNSIVLNKIAREKVNADKFELAFDRDSNTIRIMPSKEGQIMKKTKIFAKGFYKHFGINKTGKFAVKYIPEENIMYVDLNKSL